MINKSDVDTQPTLILDSIVNRAKENLDSKNLIVGTLITKHPRLPRNITTRGLYVGKIIGTGYLDADGIERDRLGRTRNSKAGRKVSLTTSKAIAPVFLNYCKQGLSLTQIADKLEVSKDTLERWARDKKKHKEFAKVFEKGKTAWQAYHETLLQKMITGQDGKYASAEITAQQFVLKTQFKSEWTEKSEAKLEVNHVGRLSDDQLEQQILNLLSKSQLQNYIIEETDNKPKLVVNNDK